MLKLREIRLRKNLSVPRLSEISSVPVRTIEDLERRGDGRISTLHKLTNALGVSLNEIYTDNKNEKINNYDDIFIYIPCMKEIIVISEGTGDNLSEEDIDNGYVDYIYYNQHQLSDNLEETDGGIVLLEELFRDKYSCTKDCIPDILDMAYDDDSISYIILE